MVESITTNEKQKPKDVLAWVCEARSGKYNVFSTIGLGRFVRDIQEDAINAKN